MRIAINKAWSTRVGSQDICRKAENELDMELKLEPSKKIRHIKGNI